MNKQKNIIEKLIQGILMLVLFILIFFMIYNVNGIQGTARVVNYAGLVRGATQRMVKLECMGIKSQDKIEQLDDYLNGIQNGSKELHLIQIKDKVYQERAAQLEQAWATLKDEIYKVRENITAFNHSGEETEISYAVGYACSQDLQKCDMTMLLEYADKYMYLDKKKTKKEAKDIEDKLDQSLRQMIKALGNIFTECYYCNAKSGTYRILSERAGSLLPPAGYLKKESEKVIQKYVVEEDREKILHLLSIANLRESLDREYPTSSVKCRWQLPADRSWWKPTRRCMKRKRKGRINIACFCADKKEGAVTYSGVTAPKSTT